MFFIIFTSLSIQEINVCMAPLVKRPVDPDTEGPFVFRPKNRMEVIFIFSSKSTKRLNLMNIYFLFFEGSHRVVDHPDRPADRWVMLSNVPFGTEPAEIEKVFSERIRLLEEYEELFTYLDYIRPDDLLPTGLPYISRVYQKDHAKGDTSIMMAVEFHCDEIGRAVTDWLKHVIEINGSKIVISRPTIAVFYAVMGRNTDFAKSVRCLETAEKSQERKRRELYIGGLNNAFTADGLKVVLQDVVRANAITDAANPICNLTISAEGNYCFAEFATELLTSQV